MYAAMPGEDRGGKQVIHVVELFEEEPQKKLKLVEDEQIRLSSSLLLATAAGQEPLPLRAILHRPTTASQHLSQKQS
jgi:hypothetical protein